MLKVFVVVLFLLLCTYKTQLLIVFLCYLVARYTHWPQLKWQMMTPRFFMQLVPTKRASLELVILLWKRNICFLLDLTVSSTQLSVCKFDFPVRLVQIAAGGKHSLAVSSTGQLFSWGSSQFGQLGHGDKVKFGCNFW